MNKMKQRLILSVSAMALAVLLLAPASQTFAQGNGIEELRKTENAFVSIAEKVFPAVVNIRVEREIVRSSSPQMPQMQEFFERFFGNPDQFRGPEFREDPEPESFQQRGGGSGFIISPDGYIITNHHVIADQDKIMVTLNDRREFEAEVIGSDADTDVALIKIDATGLPTLRMSDSDDIRVGQWAIAVGSPFGLNHTMTTGIVSSTGRFAGITTFDNLIQTDAAINPGNSGGPLLNLDGEVIGINTAIFSRSGGYMGIGFAIPTSTAESIYTQLRESGNVEKGFIGIEFQGIDQDLSESFDLENLDGIVITGVVEDSPANEAGLKVGDVIIALDGESIQDFRTFPSRVALKRPGTEIKLEVVRDGSTETVTLVLGDRSNSVLASAESSQPGAPVQKEEMGFTIQTLTPELAEDFGFGDNRGVLVTEVDRDSGAAERGLAQGMLIVEVNRTPVRSVDEFNQAIEQAEGKKSALLLIKSVTPRGDVVTRFISIPIEN